MDQSVTAAEANRAFSRILRDVRAGTTYTITTHGQPVARIVPYATGSDARAEARGRLLERLAGQAGPDIGGWSRDELYER